MIFHFKLNTQQEKLIAELRESRKKYLFLGLVLLLIFLTAIYLGPLGGLERFGLIGFKKGEEQTSLAATKPNDPDFISQWAMDKIRASAVWDITTGARTVKVAVVGSGVDSTHPDLAANMVAGYNAINSAAGTTDELFDGTTAAGVIGAVGNNNIGMAGLNWQVAIMPVKVCVVFDCDPAIVARGIRWAADNGANIIDVNALSSQDDAGDLRNAVSYAKNKGIIVVGYAFSLLGGSLWYPAAYSDVVTVGLTTRSDFSLSPAAAELDIVASGVDIVSTWPGGSTRSTDGPHLSAAHVTGVLALLLSRGVTPIAVVDALNRGAVDLGPAGRDDTYGFGRLDACGALNAAQITCPTAAGSSPLPTPTPAVTPTPSSVPTATPATGVTISGTVTSSTGGAVASAQIKVSLMPWGTPVTTVSANSEGFYTANLQPNKVYKLTVLASGYQTKTDYVTVYSSSVTRNVTLQKI